MKSMKARPMTVRFSTLRRLQKALLLLFVTSILWLPSLVGAAAGDLDLTFGSGGKATTDFFGFSDRITAIAIQQDGRIVAVGSAATGPGGGPGPNPLILAISRYNTDGSLDGTFGSGGKVTLGSFGAGEARAVAIQSDGKIVLAGVAPGVGDDFVLARLNTDGGLDSGFGSGGKVLTDFFGASDGANGVAVQTDGKIVAAGSASNGMVGFDFAVARYEADGSLDSSFGVGGKVNVDFLGGLDLGNAIALQGDGKLLVAGNAFIGSGSNINDFGVTRLNTDGSLDVTFGVSGKVTTDFSGNLDEASSLAVQADGNVVVAGRTANGSITQFGLARYSVTGILDGSFGAGGKVVTSFSSTTSEASDVAIQPDGKLVAVGRAFVSGNSRFAIARYSNIGGLDPAFGTGGTVTTDFAGNVDIAFSVALQLDGKIVAAGSTGDINTNDFALARYQVNVTGTEACIQDDSSRSLLRFNSTTGEYQFTDCQGVVIAGIGTVFTRGCTVTLQHNALDRRVLIKVDTCRLVGTASIQLFSPARTFTVTDRSTANSTCSCPAT